MPIPMEERDQVLVPVAEPLGQSPTSRLSEASRRPIWIDALVLLFLGIGIYFVFRAAHTLAGPRRTNVVIDLSPWMLPKYLGWSIFRNFVSFILSLLFTFVYGYIAAKSRHAHKVMIPVLDIFQSVPVLGFMPGLMLALMAIFPHSNIGIELVSILMIFTGQAWNMAFSFYHSLRSIPGDLREISQIYGFGWWRQFWRLELPYAAIPLIWNAKMSWAGGWFFLTVCEAIQLGNQNFLLPGIGSYMSVASTRNDLRATIYGIIAMTLTIIVIDQLIWRPIIAWSEKFRYEETMGTEGTESLILNLLRQSTLLTLVGNAVDRVRQLRENRNLVAQPKMTFAERIHFPRERFSQWMKTVGAVAKVAILVVLAFVAVYGGYRMFQFLSGISLRQWGQIGVGTGLSFLRILATLVLSSLWTIPFGILVGLKPRLSRVAQPIIQVLASFPAPMVFPLITHALVNAGISLEWGSAILLVIGTQWYMLFNATAGASAIPSELIEAAKSYRFSRRQIWRRVYLPAAFPSLVTGMIVLAGGAWNASIVAEYVYIGDRPIAATGLGAMIRQATETAQLDLLTAEVMVMVFVVVAINRLFWEPLFLMSRERYALGKE